jgi:hypothetical protein
LIPITCSDILFEYKLSEKGFFLARYARIIGWGKYLPEKVLTNQELERLVNTSDAWIMSRTGIRERRIAADDETASSMAVRAARKALKVAGVEPHSLDLVIVATCTPELIFPACASLVQNSLGAKMPPPSMSTPLAAGSSTPWPPPASSSLQEPITRFWL